MKNKRFPICLLLLISMMPFFGCTSAPTQTTMSTSTSTITSNEVSLNKEFTLYAGQNATISGENLSFKFVEVISDSRCPEGATCVWAGEVSCLVEITYSDSVYEKVLTQSGASSPSRTGFDDYEILFDIQPYPRLDTEINRQDYHLILVVRKNTFIYGYSELIIAFNNHGYSVQTDGTVNQPFFSVKGKIIRLSGDDVQVFEYKDGFSMEAEASEVSPTGNSVGTTMVTWVAPPHFYKTGNIIVLYVGSSPTVLNALESVLGTQFAGQ